MEISTINSIYGGKFIHFAMTKLNIVSQASMEGK